MSLTRSPTLRDLHANAGLARPASARPSRRARDAWILEDPDLAPPPRQETPLSAWG